MPYCIECGSEIQDSWNTCPNCGKTLKKQEVPQSKPITQPQPQPPSYQTRPYQRSSSMGRQNTYGAVALVLGIIGLICGGIIFGILAIVFGGLGLNRDENSSMATKGLVLGVIDLACFFISWFWIFSWFSWPFPF
jgi:hypothetical protein